MQGAVERSPSYPNPLEGCLLVASEFLPSNKALRDKA